MPTQLPMKLYMERKMGKILFIALMLLKSFIIKCNFFNATYNNNGLSMRNVVNFIICSNGSNGITVLWL